MGISTETIGRLLASGRNYTSTIVGFIGGIGLMSASQSKGLTDAFGEMFNGLSMIAHGATSAWQIIVVAFPIVGVIMAKMASNSAKTANQAAAVQAAVADPNTPVSDEAKTAIVKAAAPIVATEPALATAAVPGIKVS